MSESPHLHPVRVVAERTGLSPDVLRAWERRYGAVSPARTAGGQRLYSDADIERLALLQEAAASGRQVGQLVALDDAALRDLVAADLRATSVAQAPAPPAASGRHAELAYDAVVSLAPDQLAHHLRQAVLALGAMPMLAQVLIPLLRRIGDAWHRGTLSVAHEHAASVVVRRLLDWMSAAYDPGPGAPVLGLATLEGERHEFGAMVAMAAALSNGWNALYFGSELPARDLAAAVAERDLRVVGLSVVFVDDLERVAAAVRDVRRALPAGVALVVGGAGIRLLGDRLHGLDLRIALGIEDFVAVLGQLRERRG